ncbi:ankyrin repeat domain-containing protein [Oceaniglobus trochenteri]|uniref:ankyrin repeat domain-containing protein n=1 Tax=Oceaniglobus trochenteri TaxID=2763260 RepID=UPI001D0012A0|nr:ankyrin repeat domain-containing protein [Oceaniglobus trochenteri]
MPSLDELRRKATLLKRAYGAGDSAAAARVREVLGDAPAPLKRADFLHVIANEASFDSWPRLKTAAETEGLDRAAKQQRLKIALFQGQNHVTQQLLSDTPDLARGLLGLEIALYDVQAVRAALWNDPAAATRAFGPRRPIAHLAFSRYHQLRPDLREDMLEIAGLLVRHGADVNDAADHPQGRLSVLYGALCHADNLPLAEWLLEHGANPDDGETLYHATEPGRHAGLRLLLSKGADPKGTNALPRAMDFNDHEAVRMLLNAGATPDDGAGTIPALCHAARRMNDGAMVQLLLEAGADPSARWRACSAYALARVMGNGQAAERIAKAGGEVSLSETETLLARAAEGEATPGTFLDPATLPEEYRNLIADLVMLPDTRGHIERLVALGLEYDRPAAMGVTPVQGAGWAGNAELLAYFLSLRPDLEHRNDHGGSLLGTIIHGSEHAPQRAGADHVACARLALEHGLSLPRRTVDMAGAPAMRAFLADWAARFPSQVTEGATP